MTNAPTSLTEENYLKAIFALSEKEAEAKVSTNAIAARVNTAAASVTDMLKRLAEKGLVQYEKYHGAQLTLRGESIAKDLVRKHRLWEVFLMQKLGFAWDEVHAMAEDLEHVDHPELIQRLAEFLGNPRFDPHGDPIPDQHGNIAYHEELYLSQLQTGDRGLVVAVEQDDAEFLRYLVKVGLVLNAEIEILETEEYDGSRLVRIGKHKRTITEKVGQKLLVRKV
ncbi:MAG: metal-dependent transcriptional regulator [Bacteroidetes bacterium]|nr:metal-dependent transcriptional regulator [Bacteroidota bacterium]